MVMIPNIRLPREYIDIQEPSLLPAAGPQEDTPHLKNVVAAFEALETITLHGSNL